MTDPTLSVVIPVYNSATILPRLCEQLTTALDELGESWEVVLVEDSGPDDAWAVAKSIAAADGRFTAIRLLRNFGQGTATVCGLAEARGEFIVTMDDDLQHPPGEIGKLLAVLRDSDSDVDVVVGVPQQKSHALARRVGSALVNRVNSIFLGKPRHLRMTAFRAIRRVVVDALLTMRSPHPAIGPMLLTVTRRIVNVPFRHEPRREGRSGYTAARLARQTLSNVIGYSMLPLQALAAVGMAGIVFSVGFGAWRVAQYLLFGSSVPGWTTLILLVVGLSGFNFLAFAVLGEYMLRLFQLGTTTRQFLIRERVTGDDRR